MFEPFLAWLCQQDLSNLPGKVNLGKVPTAMHGYRRNRGGEKERFEFTCRDEIKDAVTEEKNSSPRTS